MTPTNHHLVGEWLPINELFIPAVREHSAARLSSLAWLCCAALCGSLCCVGALSVARQFHDIHQLNPGPGHRRGTSTSSSTSSSRSQLQPSSGGSHSHSSNVSWYQFTPPAFDIHRWLSRKTCHPALPVRLESSAPCGRMQLSRGRAPHLG